MRFLLYDDRGDCVGMSWGNITTEEELDAALAAKNFNSTPSVKISGEYTVDFVEVLTTVKTVKATFTADGVVIS